MEADMNFLLTVSKLFNYTFADEQKVKKKKNGIPKWVFIILLRNERFELETFNFLGQFNVLPSVARNQELS